jgi:hypothetical protein
MDPYLESPAYWRDFHQRFITYWCDWLADHLPDHYAVRIDERLSVAEEESGGVDEVQPDLTIRERHLHELSVVEPVTLRVKYLEEAPEAYLRVLHRPDASLIAVLELLSPTDKQKPERVSYLEKRNELIREEVHLVELDLLLGGSRLPMEDKLPAGDYYAFVSRGDRRPECEVYSWALREPLPAIRLPLKAPDPDVIFDLPGLFALAYQRGRYVRDLPYDAAPPVALSKENAVWVREQILAWKQSRGG